MAQLMPPTLEPMMKTGADIGKFQRLKQAVHRHKAISGLGLQERLFTLVFSGLV